VASQCRVLAEKCALPNTTRFPSFGTRRHAVHVYKCVEEVDGTCQMKYARGDPSNNRSHREIQARLTALHDLGAKQARHVSSSQYKGTRGLYTQEQIREIQKYHESRNLTKTDTFGRGYVGSGALALGWHNGKVLGVENGQRLSTFHREQKEIADSRRDVGGDLHGKDESPFVPEKRHPSQRLQDQREKDAIAERDAFREADKYLKTTSLTANDRLAVPNPSDAFYLPTALDSLASKTSALMGNSTRFHIPKMKTVVSSEDSYNRQTGAPAVLKTIGLPANTSEYGNPRGVGIFSTDGGSGGNRAGESLDSRSGRGDRKRGSDVGSRGNSAGKSPDSRSARGDGKRGSDPGSRETDASNRTLHPKKRHITNVDVRSGPLTVKEGWFKNLDGRFEHPRKGVHDKPEYVLQPDFYYDPHRRLWVRPARFLLNLPEETSLVTPYLLNKPWRKIFSQAGDTYYYNQQTGTSEWPPHGKTR